MSGFFRSDARLNKDLEPRFQFHQKRTGSSTPGEILTHLRLARQDFLRVRRTSKLLNLVQLIGGKFAFEHAANGGRTLSLSPNSLFCRSFIG